jgi:hypothetical protein
MTFLLLTLRMYLESSSEQELIDYRKKKPIPGSRIVIKEGDSLSLVHYYSEKYWQYEERVGSTRNIGFWRYE